ncbi:hypothetical protein [Conservatibacter flavescens]|uniref:hypothetical protein n=1 Tax=Conservatibacter flavescens TaxID=28161 RepID=UPI001055D313|nr:hypothetical protein [Conservatibacter flavescens]
MDNNTELLETLLVAQIATLAKLIEAERKARGVTGGDCYREAIQEINRNRDRILGQCVNNLSR